MHCANFQKQTLFSSKARNLNQILLHRKLHWFFYYIIVHLVWKITSLFPLHLYLIYWIFYQYVRLHHDLLLLSLKNNLDLLYLTNNTHLIHLPLLFLLKELIWIGPTYIQNGYPFLFLHALHILYHCNNTHHMLRLVLALFQEYEHFHLSFVHHELKSKLQLMLLVLNLLYMQIYYQHFPVF